MATHQTDATLDRPTVPPDREDAPIPGIAHLTVVPTNAEEP